MNELAIEAILRDDLALLASLFRLFNPNEISDWSYRGKVSWCDGLLLQLAYRHFSFTLIISIASPAYRNYLHHHKKLFLTQ